MRSTAFTSRAAAQAEVPPTPKSVVEQCALPRADLAGNTLRNLEIRAIATGFGFLWREAGLPIGEHAISYAPTDNYGRALLIGLKVSALGIVLATIIGTLIGIARKHGLLRVR
jgi:ABC-type amino acid transport system permease subunit